MEDLKFVKIPCPCGHEMFVMTAMDLEYLDPEIYTEEFACARCKNKATSYVHCLRCPYDVCLSCIDHIARNELACPKGHTLVQTSHAELINESMNYCPCYSCDGECMSYRPERPFPVHHCSLCQYDICPDCVAKKLGYPKEPNPGCLARTYKSFRY